MLLLSVLLYAEDSTSTGLTWLEVDFSMAIEMMFFVDDEIERLAVIVRESRVPLMGKAPRLSCSLDDKGQLQTTYLSISILLVSGALDG